MSDRMSRLQIVRVEALTAANEFNRHRHVGHGNVEGMAEVNKPLLQPLGADQVVEVARKFEVYLAEGADEELLTRMLKHAKDCPLVGGDRQTPGGKPCTCGRHELSLAVAAFVHGQMQTCATHASRAAGMMAEEGR